MRAWLYGDGEAIVGKALEDEVVKLELIEALIDLGKTPASCSARTQASDISDEFKAEKKVLKHIANRDWDNDPNLKNRLKAIFNTRPSLSQEFRRKGINALLQLTIASKNVMTQNIVTKGYHKYGQGAELSFKRIISACSATISPRDFKIMEEAMPEAVAVMQRDFCLTETAMDKWGIINVNRERGLPKDQRATHRMRAVLVSGKEFQDRQAQVRQRQIEAPQNAAAAAAASKSAAAENKREKARNLLDQQLRLQNRAVEKAEADRMRQTAKLLVKEVKEKEKSSKLLEKIEKAATKETERLRNHQLSRAQRMEERLATARAVLELPLSGSV